MTSTAPVLIVAPTKRCGSTLLQRLLNSTGEIIVYGENFFFLQKLPELLFSLHRNAKDRNANVKKNMELFLDKQIDFEGSGLYPDYEGFVATAISGFHGIPEYYADYSSKLGFERWGIKHQIREIGGFLFLMRLLSNARYVFIYRDLLDVACSAKSRWPRDFEKLGAFRYYGQLWRDNVRAILNLRGENHLLIQYKKTFHFTLSHSSTYGPVISAMKP